MTQNEPSKFEMAVKTQDRGYFVHGSPRGLVLGPKNSGKDDHITIGFNDGEFSQVHRKINGREEWRVTPELFQAELDSLVANNVRRVEFADLSEHGAYIVSVNRIRVLFRIPQALATVAMPMFWRLIVTKRMVRTETGKKIELSIERRKLDYLIARLNGPLSMFGKLLKHLPPKVPLKLFRLVAKWTLVHPSDPAELDGGVFLMASKDFVGLLWRSESGTLQSLPIAPLLDLYLRAERNLPFGKLNELGNGWTDDFTFIGRSW